VASITGCGELHQVRRFGSSQTARSAVDSHELIAMCALGHALLATDGGDGDAKWVDAHGSFMAASCGPVYRLLGKKGSRTPGDYLTIDASPQDTDRWRSWRGGSTEGGTT